MVLGLTLSLFIGLALGLFGGGGSILAVPILTYVMGVPPKAAIASSLLVVGITSAVGLVTLARRGLVDVRTGLEFGLAAMLGAYASGHLARFVPDAVLLVAFGIMMLVTAVAMLRGSPARGKREGTGGRSFSAVLLRGLGVGAIAGLVGAGGGFLIVPALVLLGGMPMRKAVATSLLVISLQSFAGFAGHAGHVALPWHVIAPVIVLSAIGSLLGGALVGKVRPEALRRGFAWLVLAVAVLVIGHQATAVVRGSAVYAALFVTPWPWWAGGAAIALVALGLLWVENKQLGVSTGCGEICRLPVSRAARASWRPRFLLGIVLGGATAALLSGRAPTWSMGGLDAIVHGTGAKLGLLFASGVLIGAGARLAGGCTSGHAIVGTALGARASLVATALFMLAGFATTHAVVFLSGGF